MEAEARVGVDSVFHPNLRSTPRMSCKMQGLQPGPSGATTEGFPTPVCLPQHFLHVCLFGTNVLICSSWLSAVLAEIQQSAVLNPGCTLGIFWETLKKKKKGAWALSKSFNWESLPGRSWISLSLSLLCLSLSFFLPPTFLYFLSFLVDLNLIWKTKKLSALKGLYVLTTTVVILLILIAYIHWAFIVLANLTLHNNFMR